MLSYFSISACYRLYLEYLSISVPSSPSHVQCQTLNSSAISLTWDEPSQPNGQIGKYRIQYSSHSNHALGDVNITSMSYHVNGLQPFTWYKFRVQAATGARPVFLWGNYSAYVKCRSGESGNVDGLTGCLLIHGHATIKGTIMLIVLT